MLDCSKINVTMWVERPLNKFDRKCVLSLKTTQLVFKGCQWCEPAEPLDAPSKVSRNSNLKTKNFFAKKAAASTQTLVWIFANVHHFYTPFFRTLSPALLLKIAIFALQKVPNVYFDSPFSSDSVVNIMQSVSQTEKINPSTQRWVTTKSSKSSFISEIPVRGSNTTDIGFALVNMLTAQCPGQRASNVHLV